MSNKPRFLPKPGEPYTHLSSTNGHSCVIYPISPVDGKKGTQIPEGFRRIAVAEGCDIVGMEESEKTPVKTQDKTAAIVDAISAVMERQDAEELEGDGRPKLAAIKKEAGFGVTKNQLDAAWAKYVDGLGDDLDGDDLETEVE